ncbi:MAG: DNA polymerase III subunit gamma/tau [Sphingosinicella sp.]|nr:DNA polymerase III subunit gamma/tau [Sphingosinicella sp.]
MSSESPQPYRVLARKYRPQSFEELVGQDAMVRTLGNAIKRDRLAHAFLLTGVRGVGKTSTARLIAKALNCIGPDGNGGPTISPCNVCEPCVAIAEGRHIDVIEMDAASNTGVDDVREIIEAVRYAAVSARYKVYIVDEVHMLSKNAFNALLKTLEEPPAHVKFLFATTEVNKVPVTVLSRCQRFDLRRISAEQLAAHFAAVAQKEEVEVEPEALALIARAAEGSARDGLSILDQAIAHGAGGVTADQVRAMLGLSDRGAIRVLLGLLLTGDAQGALAAIKDQYDLGVEPSALLRGLLESVHGITRAKVGGAVDPAQSHEERDAYSDWASRLSYAAIHRLWQLLLKGLGEVNSAAIPLEAAEMALLRVIHASDLPDPGAIMEKLASGEAISVAPAAASPAKGGQDALLKAPATFAGLVQMLADSGKPHIAQQLHDFVGMVRYQPPELVIRPTKPLSGDMTRDLGAALKALTGDTWQIGVSDEEAQPSLLAQEKAGADTLRQQVLDEPIVKAAFEAFPDAELTDYTVNDQRSA